MKKTLQRKQIMAYCLAAASPLLLMAIIFNFSLVFNADYIFWTNQEILGYIIQAEFLAVASGVLIVLPLLIQINNIFMRIFRFLLFAVVVVIFAWLSYDIDGMAGMLFYALLVFITFGGGTLFIFDTFSTQTRAFLTLLRWSLGIFIYVSLQLSFDLDSDIVTWKGTSDVIPFGAAFFYLLFLFELIFYPALTYYLEKKNSDDMFIAEKIAQVQAKQPH
ncbi:MAG: hypothetical protein COA71_03470 [SAR86 cluster bacterium]|uniref:Uncharacterized protein n=1 Tax=SAR86 cluster bacterium TaxID=2030880 RepID=A0A2A5CFB9_9GAMM|nr:MAG: hypothetical protein COA71_03470 [SAR86 cluster bacterium]